MKRYDESAVAALLQQPKTKDVVDKLLVLNYGLMNKQLKKFYLLNDPDALSYAYEALYNAILTYNSKSKFSTYASVCIYNKLGSYIRSIKRNEDTDLVYYQTPVGNKCIMDYIPGGTTADAEILSECGSTLIEHTVKQLRGEVTNPIQGQILDCWIEHNYAIPHDEIANRMNCTQSYVSQVIKKFRIKLKSKLEAQVYV